MSRRVVITGLGAVTSLGNGIGTLWTGIKNHRRGIGPLTRFDEPFLRCRVAAEVHDIPVPSHIGPQRLKRLDRFSRLCLAAVDEALHHAGLPSTAAQPRERWGVSFGSALGGISEAEHEFERFRSTTDGHISPYLALQVFGGASHSNISIDFQTAAYATTNSNSCASGTVAVGEGFRVIREGLADVMLCGGAEAPLCPLTFGAFDVIKAMSREPAPDKACRPFDKGRTGFVMGEGSAALILEELGHAQNRGAEILGEVTGYSLNNDAFHMTQSREDGTCAVRVIRDALAQAGLGPEQIGHINAHGSGTPLNDRNEARVFHEVFGPVTPWISATKPYYGHPLGASGAIEAALCILALREGYLPATPNCSDPEFDEGLRLTRDGPVEHAHDFALSTSFGFGGINAALVLRRWS